MAITEKYKSSLPLMGKLFLYFWSRNPMGYRVRIMGLIRFPIWKLYPRCYGPKECGE